MLIKLVGEPDSVSVDAGIELIWKQIRVAQDLYTARDIIVGSAHSSTFSA